MDALMVGGQPVASYVTRPDVEARRGPRPYLHPVRTLAGTVVTDVLPEDHPHHLGVSVAMQSVTRQAIADPTEAAGEAVGGSVNLWGGRTYVRDAGYTWLADHGRIEHVEWTRREEAVLANRMRWCAPDASTLIEEDRVMTASPVPDDDGAWRLDVSYTLTNPGPAAIVLGSPGTNGRPGKAGYGGFFWRGAPDRPRVFDPVSDDEAEVNGSTQPWVALVGGEAAGSPYTLIFAGLGEGDHWFVRATEYPGVCVALAFEHPREIAPGAPLSRHHQIFVCDGARTREQAAALVDGNPSPAPARVAEFLDYGG